MSRTGTISALARRGVRGLAGEARIDSRRIGPLLGGSRVGDSLSGASPRSSRQEDWVARRRPACRIWLRRIGLRRAVGHVGGLVARCAWGCTVEIRIIGSLRARWYGQGIGMSHGVYVRIRESGSNPQGRCCRRRCRPLLPLAAMRAQTFFVYEIFKVLNRDDYTRAGDPPYSSDLLFSGVAGRGARSCKSGGGFSVPRDLGQPADVLYASNCRSHGAISAATFFGCSYAA